MISPLIHVMPRGEHAQVIRIPAGDIARIDPDGDGGSILTLRHVARRYVIHYGGPGETVPEQWGYEYAQLNVQESPESLDRVFERITSSMIPRSDLI